MHKITEQLAALAVPINSIKTDPMNARKGHALDELARSLDIYGQVKPIVVNAKTKQIEAGNGTYQAAKNLGWSEVAVVMVDHDSQQATGYAIADNRLTDLSEFDNEILLTLLQSLDSPLDVPGVDDALMAELMEAIGGDLGGGEGEGEIVEDEVPIDKAEELLLKWQCKAGDLWLIGEHRLLCGDCTDKATVERLMNGEKADMVFTDPPYGMFLDTDYSKIKPKSDNAKEFAKAKGETTNKKYSQVIGDHEDFTPEFINTIFNRFDYCKEIFIWGADYFAELLPNKNDGSWVVWDKRTNDDGSNLDAMFGSCFELCWSKNRHKRDIARIKYAGLFGTEREDIKKRLHPTQKPILLAKWFFDRWGKERDLVADIYLGSGSTMVAAHQTGRKCFGTEISPAYCSVILERMSKLGLEPIREQS